MSVIGTPLGMFSSISAINSFVMFTKTGALSFTSSIITVILVVVVVLPYCGSEPFISYACKQLYNPIPAGTQCWNNVCQRWFNTLDVESTFKQQCFNVVCPLDYHRNIIDMRNYIIKEIECWINTESKTWMTQTPMARLQRLSQTHFRVHRKLFL